MCILFHIFFHLHISFIALSLVTLRFKNKGLTLPLQGKLITATHPRLAVYSQLALSWVCGGGGGREERRGRSSFLPGPSSGVGAGAVRVSLSTEKGSAHGSLPFPPNIIRWQLRKHYLLSYNVQVRSG